MKKLFVASMLLALASCTKKEEAPPPPAPVSQEAPDLSVKAEETATPADAAAAKDCQEKWTPAALAFRELKLKPSKTTFQKFSAAIPPKYTFKDRCDAMYEVGRTLDGDIAFLEKAAGSVFEFTVLLARLQYISDGATGEAICEAGPVQLKKDSKAFLQALKQEQANLSLGSTSFSCLYLSTAFDGPEEEYKKDFPKRISALQKVKDKDLAEMRDQMIDGLKTRLE